MFAHLAAHALPRAEPWVATERVIVTQREYLMDMPDADFARLLTTGPSRTTLVMTNRDPAYDVARRIESQCLGWGGHVTLVVVWVGGSHALLCARAPEPPHAYISARIARCPEDAGEVPEDTVGIVVHMAPHMHTDQRTEVFLHSRTIFVRPDLPDVLTLFALLHRRTLRITVEAGRTWLVDTPHWELDDIPPLVLVVAWFYWHRHGPASTPIANEWAVITRIPGYEWGATITVCTLLHTPPHSSHVPRTCVCH